MPAGMLTSMSVLILLYPLPWQVAHVALIFFPFPWQLSQTASVSIIPKMVLCRTLCRPDPPHWRHVSKSLFDRAPDPAQVKHLSSY